MVLSNPAQLTTGSSFSSSIVYEPVNTWYRRTTCCRRAAVYLAQSLERNNRSARSSDCHSGDSQLILQASLSDTDRLTGPSGWPIRSVLIATRSKPAWTAYYPCNVQLPRRAPANSFRFAPSRPAASGTASRWRRNKISLISLGLSQPTAIATTTRDYLNASARAASNPNVPLALPQLYHYKGPALSVAGTAEWISIMLLRTQIANCSSCRVQTANTNPACLSCRLQLMHSVRYVLSFSPLLGRLWHW